MKKTARLHPGDNTIRLALCLLTAVAIWLILAMNDTYEYHTDLELKIESPPDQGYVGDVPQSVQLKVRASGWNLIRLQTRIPIMDYSYESLRDRSVIDLKSDLSTIETLFPDELEVLDVYPSFIPLNWIQQISKMVPVQPNISGIQGYTIIQDSTTTDPDSIQITSSLLEADNISDWPTEEIFIKNEAGYQTGTVALENPEGVKISASVVHYQVLIREDANQQ